MIDASLRQRNKNKRSYTRMISRYENGKKNLRLINQSTCNFIINIFFLLFFFENNSKYTYSI